ncbi:MAG: ATPase [Rhodospirillaceae bacterium]|nr:ATPase [Rhodospirillaceae bacterium]|tara:strand:+ start:2906 stop:3757 length:852 start_codon:yes stop_codon:yes gene_type:complete
MLSKNLYIADRSIATSLFISFQLGRPIFLEGEAGVGKTELARVLSIALRRNLVRLQCYEGLDISSAVYEWNYSRQMIAIRLAEASGDQEQKKLNENIFSKKYLISRPLLQALESTANGPPILLIDELDRADEPFEAFLLELLSEFQVTIPEIGTIKADKPPIVIITSNRTREIHDALKRRCLYHWLDYPTASRELSILKTQLPDISEQLAVEIIEFVQSVRQLDLFKSPGIAETIDWAKSLIVLETQKLNIKIINETMGVLLKYQDDIHTLTNSDLFTKQLNS